MPDQDQNQDTLKALAQDAAGDQQENQDKGADAGAGEEDKAAGDQSADSKATGDDKAIFANNIREVVKAIPDEGDQAKDPAAPPVVQETKENAAPAVVDMGVTLAAPTAAITIDNTTSIVQEAKPTVAAVEEQTSEEAEPSVFQQIMTRVDEQGSTEQKALVQFLQNYCVELAPRKPQDPAVAVNHQYALWDKLKAVVTHPDNDEFRRQWFIVLAFFEEHKNGALGGARVFRFAESWNRDKDGLKFKHRLINIIHCISNFENRKEGLKEVDLDRSLEGMFTEAVRNRLIALLKQ